MEDFDYTTPENNISKAEREELLMDTLDMAKGLEGKKFEKFPGVKPEADEKNRNEEASMTEEERYVMFEVCLEPSYEDIVKHLEEEGFRITVQGKSVFVTPALSEIGTLAISALNINAFMDGVLAELVIMSQKLRRSL